MDLYKTAVFNLIFIKLTMFLCIAELCEQKCTSNMAQVKCIFGTYTSVNLLKLLMMAHTEVVFWELNVWAKGMKY